MKSILTAQEICALRESDYGYNKLERCIREEFKRNTEDTKILFRTNSGRLYDLFLDNIPYEARQYYNCNACRHFVNGFGGLVRINEDGIQVPVMWTMEDVPEFFSCAVEAIMNAVKKAKVTGVFLTDKSTLGTPVTGSWTHMAVDMPKSMIYCGKLKTAYQAEAEKFEDYKLLRDAVGRYSIGTVKTAVNILKSEQLYRSENVLGVAEWFMKLLQAVGNNKMRNNILWYYSTNAPVGFCHISSSMIGTLLDDIEAGFGFETVKSRFDKKMNPLQYQRPQAAPTRGNVAQAEKIVEKLGIKNSLKRRYARVEELETIWKPKQDEKRESCGIFANVKTKEELNTINYNISVQPVVMTLEKFNRSVLPYANKIEFYVSGNRDSFAAVVTAEDMNAPPIIRWDKEGNRNPFSWYTYPFGSTPEMWNLDTGYDEVTAVAFRPDMWRESNYSTRKSILFILDGAKDKRHNFCGLALFPEILKSDLREIRSTIEAYSKTEKLSGFDESSACGVMLNSGRIWNARFKVTTDIGVTEYILDRWD